MSREEDSRVEEMYGNDIQYGCGALLLVHTVLLIIFAVTDVKVLLFYNILSVVFYAVLFVLKNKQDMISIWHIYSEVIVCSCLSVYELGWRSGFQLYIVAIIISLFYVNYLMCKLNIRKINAFILAFVFVVIFVIMHIITLYRKPACRLDNDVLLLMYIINVVITATSAAQVLHRLETIALSNEVILYRQANKDVLTQLDNRRNMLNTLEKITEKGMFNGTDDFSLAIIDIDDFKSVNDMYGHNAGDHILREVGKCLEKLAEARDTLVCRWGGEEFLIVLSGDSSNERLYDSLREFTADISKRDFIYDDNRINITMTVGIAKYRQDDTSESIIGRADRYLYTGKGSGKNIVIAGDR